MQSDIYCSPIPTLLTGIGCSSIPKLQTGIGCNSIPTVQAGIGCSSIPTLQTGISFEALRGGHKEYIRFNHTLLSCIAVGKYSMYLVSM